MPRLDTSPQSRLRHLASTLRLTENDVQEAMAVSKGDAAAAARYLKGLTITPLRSPRGPITSKEERIKKCARALARTPQALDILHASLTKVLAQPHNEKLRKVNANAGAFKEKVASKSPAAVELLYAVGYEPLHGYLVLQNHQPSTLTLALAELEAARATSVYVDGKAVLVNEQARQEALAKEEAAAASRRAVYLAKVPKEPAHDDGGRASSTCVIAIRLKTKSAPEALPQDQPRIAVRRFESDNTLDDLVNFVRSLPEVPEAELVLENVTTRPTRLLDAARQGTESLYALDLWPRGSVQVCAAA